MGTVSVEESSTDHTVEALVHIEISPVFRAGGEGACEFRPVSLAFEQLKCDPLVVIIVHLLEQVLLREDEEDGCCVAHLPDLLHPPVYVAETLSRVGSHAEEERVCRAVLDLPVDAEFSVARRILNLQLYLAVTDHFRALEDIEHSRLVVLGELILEVVRDQARLADRGVTAKHQLQSNL